MFTLLLLLLLFLSITDNFMLLCLRQLWYWNVSFSVPWFTLIIWPWFTYSFTANGNILTVLYGQHSEILKIVCLLLFVVLSWWIYLYYFLTVLYQLFCLSLLKRLLSAALFCFLILHELHAFAFLKSSIYTAQWHLQRPIKKKLVQYRLK